MFWSGWSYTLKPHAMTVRALALFGIIEFPLCLSPGPAVPFVVGQALRHGSGRGTMAASGIVATTAAYFALSALGIGTLIMANATLFTILKWIDALYLAWLCITMFISVLSRRGDDAEQDHFGHVEKDGALSRRGRGLADPVFIRGAILQAFNPKNMAFFVAILPQFMDPDFALGPQLL